MLTSYEEKYDPNSTVDGILRKEKHRNKSLLIGAQFMGYQTCNGEKRKRKREERREEKRREEKREEKRREREEKRREERERREERREEVPASVLLSFTSTSAKRAPICVYEEFTF
ncbi:hypothetical protein DUI87_22949 [Hirundo rustica rustica]|uniref:Uncharacterized protein n=1 Tax=Hirundo rustica rustica TaxID=333673 RepID=A0A3M0JJ42_HIRRU|nr:hypothetical protein DUI87_22949 [Hirundo rustica rustica]